MRPFYSIFCTQFMALALWITLQPLTALASSPDEATNLREACRRVTSGSYLDIWDKASQTKKLLESMRTKKKALDQSLKAETNAFEKMKALQSSSDYDLDLARKVDTKTGLIQTLTFQQQELASVITKAEQDAIAARKAEETMKKLVVTVFDIKKHAGKERPEKLDYKAACPKFKYLCPLPRDHAIRLRDITNMEPCIRYADQSINGK
jgi:hypothetical protein